LGQRKSWELSNPMTDLLSFTLRHKGKSRATDLLIKAVSRLDDDEQAELFLLVESYMSELPAPMREALSRGIYRSTP
jgi:hypothetical protein